MKSVTTIEKDGREFLLETFVDISEAERALFELENTKKGLEDKVEERTAHLRGIIDTANNGIIVTDDHGVITEFSPAAQGIFGYTRKEVIGRKINILMPDSFNEKHDQYIRNYLESGESRVIGRLTIVTAKRKDGSLFPMEVALNSDIVNGKSIFVAVLCDVTDRKAMEDELRRSQEKYQRLVEELGGNFVIFSHTPEGNVLFVSEGVSTVFGLSKEEMIGQRWQDVIRWQSGAIAKSAREFDEMKALGQTYMQVEMGYTHRDGTDRLALISEHLVYGESGQVVSIDGIIEDITLRKTAELALAEAKDAAEEATKAKSDFLANMSHEIRTPMNAIMGLSQLTLQTELNDRQRDYIEKLHSSAEYLLGILNDILDFSKIEASKLELEYIQFYLEDVFENLASVIGLKAQVQKLEVMFDLPSDLPTALVGDPLRLGQILLNLGNNAIKFTQQGEVVIAVRVIEERDDEIKLCFSVRDTGIGLTVSQKTKLFQQFSQADSTITRKYGGAGLGLAISKKLVEMMGGEIWVESEFGTGSTFFFTVPFAKQSGDAQLFTAHEDSAHLHTLVVDDNPTARTIFTNMLTGFGFRVDAAATSDSALRLLEAQVKEDIYDLAVIDWDLPGTNGIELVRSMQTNARIMHCPRVILVTAYNRMNLWEEAEPLVSIVEILNKPVMPSTLFNSVMRAKGLDMYLDMRQAKQRSIQDEVTPRLQQARVLLVEDNEINQMVAKNLLVGYGITVKVASNGLEALVMIQAEDFDCVLMDCQMPLMDGYTATKKIREMERFKNLPIIAMTANVMIGDRERSLEAGMNDHIGKPIRIHDLLRVMRNWIGLAPVHPSLPQDARTVETMDVPGLDIAAALVLLQGNVDLFRQLLKEFCDTYNNFETTFKTAWDEHDKDTAVRLAHTLKGVAGNLRMSAVAEAASNLERACRENSPEEHVGRLLGNVSQVLASILKSLGNYLKPSSPVQQMHQTEDAQISDMSSDLVQRLRTCIEESDIEALEVLKVLREQPGAARYAAEMNNLSAALDRYDFDTALAELDKLKLS